MSGGGSPVHFEAVGGHKSSIFYGETARDGRSTLQKKTTAWEILYYVAMELAKDESKRVLREDERTPPKESDSTRTKFVHAAGKLAAFAPQLFSIRFPPKFVPQSAELQARLADGNPAAAAATAGAWVNLEEGSSARVLLAPLFNELFDAMEELKGFDDAYDSGIWGIGLINETSGMTQPCVMDVKVGFIRHSPLTPSDKVERMMKKEHNSLMRDTALRICGTQRYVYAAANASGDANSDSPRAIESERFGKDIGYAVSTVPELSNCLKLFLSTGVPLAQTAEEDQLVFRPEELDAVPPAEKVAMQKRVADIRADVAALLHFFEETPDGAFLLQHMAFVSTSVLMLYDAAASPATARLRFIDFARSTWRRFNFDEPTIGFIQGLKNLDTYLA